ncbi:thiamine phosphate synthase [Erythrobacter sp. NFXS35]|uniref:thiamine phosphate synthase n=1 Tax=Erythrobacter sp. NFXS35 TaxID=2818436 RepID=UPI0032DF3144
MALLLETVLRMPGIGSCVIEADGISDDAVAACFAIAAPLRRENAFALGVKHGLAVAMPYGIDAVVVDSASGAIALVRGLVGRSVAIGVDCGSRLAVAVSADFNGADFVRYTPEYGQSNAGLDLHDVDWWRESMAKPMVVRADPGHEHVEELFWSGADIVEFDVTNRETLERLLERHEAIADMARRYST